MKTRFDMTESWVISDGTELLLSEMSTRHMLNILSIFAHRPDRTLSMLVSDIEEGTFSDAVWRPVREKDRAEFIRNVTSLSANTLIHFALVSPLGRAIRDELEERGVAVDNALAVLELKTLLA